MALLSSSIWLLQVLNILRQKVLLRGQILAVFSMGSGGLMVFSMKYPVVRIAAIKKGWKTALFPGDHIFSH